MSARGRVAALLVAVLAAAGCTAVPGTGTPAATTVTVTPDRPATLQVDAGLRVDLGAGSVTAPASLSAHQVTSADVPAPLQATGPVWQLDLSGSSLVRPATLTWTVPPATDGGPPAARPVFYDEQMGRWTDVDARPGPTPDTLVVTTSHFSRWALLRWSVDALKAAAVNALTAVLNPALPAPPPCPNPDAAKTAGVTVTSSDGALARWCVGRDGDTTVLHVTNNRGYALSLLRPASWDVRSLGPEQPLLDSIANTVAAWATAAPRGYRSEMLGPGQTVELTVRGPYTDVAVSPSGAAFDLSALVYGLQTLSMTFGKVPGGPDVSNGKLIGLARAVLDDADCVSNFQKLAAGDGSTAGGLVDVFKSAVTLTFTCLEKVEKIQFSANEVLAGFWLGALVWLADGVKQIFQGFVALVDTVQNIGGYIIRVTLPAATPTPTQPPDPGAQPTPQGPTPGQPPDPGAQPTPQRPAPGGLTARRRDESGSLVVEVDWTAVPGATAYDVVGSAAGTPTTALRVTGTTALDQQHYCSPTVAYTVRAAEPTPGANATFVLDTPVDCTPDVHVISAILAANGTLVVSLTCNGSARGGTGHGTLEILVDGKSVLTDDCRITTGAGVTEKSETVPGISLQNHTVAARTSSASGTKTSNAVTVAPNS